MVRLKVRAAGVSADQFIEFQFPNGSIKSFPVLLKGMGLLLFQFPNGSIKSG